MNSSDDQFGSRGNDRNDTTIRTIKKEVDSFFLYRSYRCIVPIASRILSRVTSRVPSSYARSPSNKSCGV